MSPPPRHERIVAIVQARMGSSRRPGKVLAPILGAPMLAHVVRRGHAAGRLDGFVVATTDRPADDAVAACAASLGVSCFRGDEADVLDRYHRAAVEHRADVVVRLTADDPFVDGPFVDDALAAFVAAGPGCAYLDTTASETFPVGMAVQVFTAGALADAAREARDPYEREHVVPYLHDRPERFGCAFVACDDDLSHVRLTVDTEADLERARRIFGHFGHGDFPWRDAVRVAGHLAPDPATAAS